MGRCRQGLYTSNEVVTHSNLMCFGGFGQPTCPHLRDCRNENGPCPSPPMQVGGGTRQIRRVVIPRRK